MRPACGAKNPIVSINCGAFPETLLESELFGYFKGAFTGAETNRKGIIESANGGTLFLDEIGETSPTMQVKLLRVLQERRVRPLGGSTDVSVDVRLIASTNRDLKRMVAAGQFREDFYYRISVIPIHVPPLRERPDDIALFGAPFSAQVRFADGERGVGVRAGRFGSSHTLFLARKRPRTRECDRVCGRDVRGARWPNLPGTPASIPDGYDPER